MTAKGIKLVVDDQLYVDVDLTIARMIFTDFGYQPLDSLLNKDTQSLLILKSYVIDCFATMINSMEKRDRTRTLWPRKTCFWKNLPSHMNEKKLISLAKILRRKPMKQKELSKQEILIMKKLMICIVDQSSTFLSGQSDSKGDVEAIDMDLVQHSVVAEAIRLVLECIASYSAVLAAVTVNTSTDLTETLQKNHNFDSKTKDDFGVDMSVSDAFWFSLSESDLMKLLLTLSKEAVRLVTIARITIDTTGIDSAIDLVIRASKSLPESACGITVCELIAHFEICRRITDRHNGKDVFNRLIYAPSYESSLMNVSAKKAIEQFERFIQKTATDSEVTTYLSLFQKAIEHLHDLILWEFFINNN